MWGGGHLTEACYPSSNSVFNSPWERVGLLGGVNTWLQSWKLWKDQKRSREKRVHKSTKAHDVFEHFLLAVSLSTVVSRNITWGSWHPLKILVHNSKFLRVMYSPVDRATPQGFIQRQCSIQHGISSPHREEWRASWEVFLARLDVVFITFSVFSWLGQCRKSHQIQDG